MSSKTKQLFRVNLVFEFGITRSVFIRARSREEAERRALRRHPKAIRTDRSPFPQN